MTDLSDPEHCPGTLRFSVLGPLSVEADGRPLELGPLKQRLVLAMLLCCPGTVVSVDMLTMAVWSDEPPRTARKNLQVYVSALRRTLAESGTGAEGRLLRRSGGYLLRPAEAELDSLRFDRLVRAGRAAASAGDFPRAAHLMGQARQLWTGPPLMELACSEPVREAAERITARYLAVSEDWAEAALAAGQVADVAEATGDLVEAHPLRERLRAAHMTALHRSGRRAEALAAYDELRQHLSRELGLSPSPALESVYRSILADEVGYFTGPASAGAGGQRRAPVVLPPDVRDFTGRESQLRELTERATDGNTVSVVVGPAGVGKTALAARVAHRLEREFPDGRIWVRLRADDGTPRSLASLTAELLQYAGLAATPGSPEQAAAVWRTWLADRKVLLVLDDAPDEAAVRQLTPGSGPSAVLVTARSRLAGLASVHRIEVQPYSPAEALELLGRIIGPERANRDVAAAERIVTACGLLPLAVRVAGLKLAVLRHLTLGEYASRLADPRSVLDELAVGDNDVRSRVADEWRQLGEPARSALLQLAAAPLARAFTAPEAATALGCDPVRAQRQLESLIERGAVVSPEAEVTAHATLYSVPHFTHLYANSVSIPAVDHCRTFTG
ncbi:MULTISPECIES: BTAD domain-containing putative transcriptional regulator [Streptacidiphilus]|uniref:BTAD domain-containing putative transcriptional regulator n=2 Tax=Streptacidiphilus TaxID=228398 RepID=A0ABV6UIE0_9ACTN|nr:BTAD domain-containing putative transcriptional regulator [Streptacidiphilus jeojiense]